MKEKGIIFIVGLLIGAIISTGSIYIYTIANNSNDKQENVQMPNDNRQSRQMGENGATPPDMPNNEQNNNQGSD